MARNRWTQVLRVAADAKKLNARIEDYIYRHFVNRKNELADDQRDLAEKYSILRDAVVTDFNVTPQEMVDAQAMYIFWRDRASTLRDNGAPMTAGERKSAGMDHADTRHSTRGISAPAAGGLPSQ